MHHLPKLFTAHRTKRQQMDSTSSPTHRAGASPKPRPRLERRNAAKNIDYEPSSFCSASTSTSTSSYSPDDSCSIRSTRSLDVYTWGDKTSFRIEGNHEGEFDIVCKSLGLSPEDFAIPIAAWEAMKRSSSDVLPRVSALEDPPVAVRVTDVNNQKSEGDIPVLDSSSSGVILSCENSAAFKLSESRGGDGGRCNGGGIKGVRPPVLAPPPAMTLPIMDAGCSTWDIVRSFGPEGETVFQLGGGGAGTGFSSEDEGENIGIVGIGGSGVLSESYSFSTASNHDDSSSTSTEPVFSISPNGRFTRKITSWEKGELLGRGSFGSVYEGIAE